MEVVLIRHGQGEHTLDLPQSLQISDPSLTEEGISQAKALRKQFPLTKTDVIVVSPVRRTLQTALIWSEAVACQKIVSPLVSPRMFPQKREWKTLPCDELLTREKIKDEFPDMSFDEDLSKEFWTKGINTSSDQEFKEIAEKFLEWCYQTGETRIYVVSHDGTISSYRQFITGKKLSRDDFPKETEWITINL
ncbi:phosphoglycerate mutase family protein [Radiobacillus kanasensis]|uniref:histidine phosphatase family protein n=1 Tax=Radiobacillus kanasensis TaxID=2844358 RepID=UPI001E2FFD5C|nr:histidine phosphatase family protein [Radiobacillus kanasensis]UFT99271.1 phosphoglycerate mutase family protein [Radiobacillus kanasensis]